MQPCHFEDRTDPVRIGLIGGGPGTFGGLVHPMAARLDGRLKIVAGVFSRDPNQSTSRAAIHDVSPERAYRNPAEMYAAESARADGIEAVAIVSPRATHFKLAKGALEAGLHVICEKPVTESAEEARELQRLADQKDVIFCLTHGYSGYPMIRHARAMIAEGAIGDVRMLHVEFSLGMGASRDESKATRAPWSFDLSAIPYTWIMLEVGSHAEHLARYVTGLLPVEVCAEINAASPLFPFDDTALLMVRYDNAARGMMWVSVSAAGSTLGSLRLRVYGQLGALEWSHARPEELIYTQVDKPRQTLVRGEPGMSDLANMASRIPQGLPEGFLEAFANLYRDFSEAVRAKKKRNNLASAFSAFPVLADGVKAMEFSEAAYRSALNRSAWTSI